MQTETALELDTDAAGYTGGEAVHFGGFPGVWEPGRPVAVSELGFDSEEEALALVAELELPLRQVDVDAGSAPMPERANHLESQEDVRAEDLAASAKEQAKAARKSAKEQPPAAASETEEAGS